MTLQWQESYKTGDAEIDTQHQALFEHVNQFLAATDSAGKLRQATALLQHTREHFVHEEQLMRRVSYPESGMHAKLHADLLVRLNALTERLGHDTVIDSELEEFLGTWLVHHMATADAKLASYIWSYFPTWADSVLTPKR